MKPTAWYLGLLLFIIGVISIVEGYVSDFLGLMASGLVPLFAGGWLMKKAKKQELRRNSNP